MSSINNKNYINITYKNKKTEYPAKFCHELFSKYDSNSKILDVGCGNGDFTTELQLMGFDVHGIDMVEASPLGERFVKVDLQKDIYPFPDDSLDIVFSKSVIEHLRDPDHMVDEVYRILKPSGVFICMTPSWKHSYKEQFYIDHTHVTPFTRHSLETICELSGFEPQCSYFYQLPLLWKYPILNIFRRILNLFNLPYKPFSQYNLWPLEINKVIRFSREPMLLCVAKKGASDND
jgi:SAM-dependent methyltransferase|tara:strand:+ start:1540 stop:2241 length:702 start_codon:yes stop_codon:yes gene_type:complete